MKIKYINGEKVYVEEESEMVPWGGSDWNRWDGTMQICKHRDVVRILNILFEQAEENPEEVPRELWSLLNAMGVQFGSQWWPHWEIIDKEEAVFDDPHKIRLSRQAKLHAKRRINYNIQKPYVINGGLI